MAGIPVGRLVGVTRPGLEPLAKSVDCRDLAQNEEAGLGVVWSVAAVISGKFERRMAERVVKKCSQQKVIGMSAGAVTVFVANLVVEIARKGDETSAEVGEIRGIDVELLRGRILAVAAADFDAPSRVFVGQSLESDAFFHIEKLFPSRNTGAQEISEKARLVAREVATEPD
jgi:hypothetical protein